ncbi:MAG: 50S ribosomal protein L9 [Eubacteriales bacterium]|nr:50S ribosomal protein L9 [Eubacteriales bacterium]
MKILLLEDVAKLGKAGDLVEVKAGYANNYLIPQGLASAATRANMNEVKAKQKAAIARAQRLLEEAEATGKRLQGKIISIGVKAGEGGRIYGTVTNQDVADQLASQDIMVDKRNIQIADNIKELGQYEATVRLHSEVTVPFTLELKALED